MEHDEFEVIHTLVTLARSGAYKRKEPLFDRMRELFPGIKDEELITAAKRSFSQSARDTYDY